MHKRGVTPGKNEHKRKGTNFSLQATGNMSKRILGTDWSQLTLLPMAGDNGGMGWIYITLARPHRGLEKSGRESSCQRRAQI